MDGYIMISEPLQLKKSENDWSSLLIVYFFWHAVDAGAAWSPVHLTDTSEVQQTLKIQPLIQTCIRNYPYNMSYWVIN